MQLSAVVLALNAGSSSLKFGLFAERPGLADPAPLALGVAREGSSGNRMRTVNANGVPLTDEPWPGTTLDELIGSLMGWIESQPHIGSVAAVGHRIVHGGTKFLDPVEIDDEVASALEALVPLAPLHQPACLAPVRAIGQLRPDLRQLACFDTSFHQDIAPPVSRYALPRKFEAEGIRRYGFHGLSYQSIAAQLLRDEHRSVCSERIIIAHLGNGASLCALRDLRSVDTTMGFSTLDGLVMGTRPGSLDPGIILYLMKERGYSVHELERILYRESGLLGVSGISANVEDLLDSAAPAAGEALQLFAFQVARQTAALAATLGGLDRFIFTGGIGENAVAVRRMVADRLGLFGARLDEEANAANATRISSDQSAILIERRATQEELSIARQVCAALAGQVPPGE